MESIFQPAKVSLTRYHDEREQVIRRCRDVTAVSKKVIFCTHRIEMSSNVYGNIHTQLVQHMQQLSEALADIGNIYEQSEHFYQFKASISNAVEEMVEAFMFLHYVCTGTILPYGTFVTAAKMLMKKECAKAIDLLIREEEDSEEKIEKGDVGVSFIFPGDYFMGLFDLTGEVMRYSIVSVSQSAQKTTVERVFRHLRFIREIQSQVQGFFDRNGTVSVNRGVFEKDKRDSVGKKMQVLSQSIGKVESALCQVVVKQNEVIV